MKFAFSFLSLALILSPVASAMADSQVASNSIVDDMSHGKTPYEALGKAFKLGTPSQQADFPTSAQVFSKQKRMTYLANNVSPDTTPEDLVVSPNYAALLQDVETTTNGQVPNGGPLFPGNPGVTTTSTSFILGALDANQINNGMWPLSDAQIIASYGYDYIRQFTMHFATNMTYEQFDSSYYGERQINEYRSYRGLIIARLKSIDSDGSYSTYNYFWTVNP